MLEQHERTPWPVQHAVQHGRRLQHGPPCHGRFARALRIHIPIAGACSLGRAAAMQSPCRRGHGKQHKPLHAWHSTQHEHSMPVLHTARMEASLERRGGGTVACSRGCLLRAKTRILNRRRSTVRRYVRTGWQHSRAACTAVLGGAGSPAGKPTLQRMQHAASREDTTPSTTPGLRQACRRFGCCHGAGRAMSVQRSCRRLRPNSSTLGGRSSHRSKSDLGSQRRHEAISALECQCRHEANRHSGVEAGVEPHLQTMVQHVTATAS
mmetsp:Transcript_21774/g.65122  ORF Transcript_21774/g.65122 Transcript_21774/m.65122 type:complete len:266 (+) Transcript_21774:1333-2130(+)